MTFQMQRVAPSRSGTSCPRSSAGATWVEVEVKVKVRVGLEGGGGDGGGR